MEEITVVDAKLAYYNLRECGWKYELAEESSFQTDLRPPKIMEYKDAVGDTWVRLNTNGIIWFKEGYSWDGASGPTLDTPSSMRGALIHDGLYQLMGAGLLDQSYRAATDKELEKWCRKDGMWWWRADLWHWAVSKFAGSAAKAGRKDAVTAKVRYAP